jgi:hypothetical protein
MTPNSKLTVETERRVLQALCQGTPQGSVRETAKRLLQSYRWRDAVHQVIFEVIVLIPSEDFQVLRDQLPIRVTRRGFPDVPWKEFFNPHTLSKDEVERLIDELVGSA